MEYKNDPLWCRTYIIADRFVMKKYSGVQQSIYANESENYYKKIYFRINKTANTYISGVTFFAFPQKICNTT